MGATGGRAIEVRRADASRLPEVAALHDATMPELVFCFAPWRGGIDDERDVVWLALDEEGAAVGYLAASWTRRSNLYVRELGVVEGWRGADVGARLLGAAASLADAAGAHLVLVQARPGEWSERLRAWYRRHGFHGHGSVLHAGPGELLRHSEPSAAPDRGATSS